MAETNKARCPGDKAPVYSTITIAHASLLSANHFNFGGRKDGERGPKKTSGLPAGIGPIPVSTMYLHSSFANTSSASNQIVTGPLDYLDLILHKVP